MPFGNRGYNLCLGQNVRRTEQPSRCVTECQQSARNCAVSCFIRGTSVEASLTRGGATMTRVARGSSILIAVLTSWARGPCWIGCLVPVALATSATAFAQGLSLWTLNSNYVGSHLNGFATRNPPCNGSIAALSSLSLNGSRGARFPLSQNQAQFVDIDRFISKFSGGRRCGRHTVAELTPIYEHRA